MIEEIFKIGGCFIIDAKGVFDAICRNESAALSMQDKRSAVEGLALREDTLDAQERCCVGVTAMQMSLTR